MVSARRAVELGFDSNLNGSRVPRTSPRLEPPLSHGLDSFLIKSVAYGCHNGNMVREAISAHNYREGDGAIDLRFVRFLGAFRIWGMCEDRCLVGTRRRVLIATTLKERLGILRFDWWLLLTPRNTKCKKYGEAE